MTPDELAAVEAAEVVFCTYGQCADATVPCPRCTVLVVGGEEEAPR